MKVKDFTLRQKTEDRRQKTEDRRQKTEDRRQKTEDRRQKTTTSTTLDRQVTFSFISIILSRNKWIIFD